MTFALSSLMITVQAASRLGACTAALLTILATTSATAQETPARPVKLMTVTAANVGTTRQFFGQVVARQTVDLAFQVGGQIKEFPVIEGQQIAEGSLIAQLDLEPFELQRDQAELELAQAERTLERFNQLSSASVSQVSIDDAGTAVNLAKIAVRNAEYSLEHATLVAPFDALVAVRDVANFTTVTAGTPVIRLHDMSDLRIEIDVPEVLFQRAGRDANVTLHARFPISDTLYPLAVREFNAQASDVGQTFRLTLGMEHPEGLNILPGSSVTVLASLDTDQQRPILPATAIRLGNDGTPFVMVFTPTDPSSPDSGTVEMREVVIEADRKGTFRLVSGVALGEEIAETGAPSLTDGQTVRRFTSFSE